MTPRTEVGRALLHDYYAANDARETVGYSLGDRILAIEAEAAAQERERIREAILEAWGYDVQTGSISALLDILAEPSAAQEDDR